MTFNKNQLEIIERCKEKNACEEEFTKLVNSKTSKDFWKVINDNLGWVLDNKIITNKDFSKVKDKIFTKDYYKYLYCSRIKDRKDLWKTITYDYYKYLYCLYVKDREELWKTITYDLYKYWYCLYVKYKEKFGTIFGN